MYPSGINQHREMQKGTFVEVKGYGEQMEGRSRPGFFRGVATVVTKLFNIIQVGSQPFHPSDLLLTSTRFFLVLFDSQLMHILAKKIFSKHFCYAVSAVTFYSLTPHLNVCI